MEILIGIIVIAAIVIYRRSNAKYGEDKYSYFAPIYYIKKDKITGKYIQINWDGPLVSGPNLKLPYKKGGYLYQKSTLGGDADGFQYYRVKRAPVG